MNSSQTSALNFSGRKETSVSVFVWLTALYIFCWYLQLGNRIALLETVRFEFCLGLFLSLVGVYKLSLDMGQKTILRGPVVIWLLILGLYTVFSFDREQSWEIYFNRVLKFSMMALFIASFVKSEKELKIIIFAFFLAMMKLGQEGVVGWLTGGLVWENQGIMRLHGSTDMYKHPNSFSGMAVGCLPFIFYLYPVANKVQRLLLLLLLGACLVIILFTGSRTGYVATCLLALYFWREQLKKSWIKAIFFGSIAVLAVIIFTPEQYVGRFVSIYTLEEAQGQSANARINILKDAWEVFKAHPFGVGVAAFPAVRIEMFGKFQDTHNLYLEILTNTSLFGLLAFLFLLKTIHKGNVEVISTSTSALCVALGKAVIAFIYARLFLGLFGMDTYEIYWWFAIGLTVANINISRRQAAASSRSELGAIP